MAQTMFDRYGGFSTISKVVSGFYQKALESEILAHHFENVDMRKLIDHQTKFVASVMGGPASYSDAELERVHSRLNITEDEFSEMVELFVETLEDHDIEQSDVSSVASEIRRRKHVIVTGGRR